MSQYHHQDLTHIVEGSKTLKRLALKAKLLHELNMLLTDHIPATQRKHCKVANFRDNQIIIACTSAAWATKIRMQSADLLKHFRLTLAEAANIKVSIEMFTAQHNNSSTVNNSPTISTHAANQLGEFANNIQNERLREVLTRLSTRANDA
jgi:hypothetical protein